MERRCYVVMKLLIWKVKQLHRYLLTWLTTVRKIWNFISTLLPRLIIVQSLKWLARSTNNCIVVRLVKSWGFSGCEFCERDSVGVERRKVNKRDIVARRGSFHSFIHRNRFSSIDERLFINKLFLIGYHLQGKKSNVWILFREIWKNFQDSLLKDSIIGDRTCRIF